MPKRDEQQQDLFWESLSFEDTDLTDLSSPDMDEHIDPQFFASTLESEPYELKPKEDN